MLIHAVDPALLAEAERLSAEVAARLAAARATGFESEAAAESCLWEVVALMQQQASVTARVLTTAIDVRAAMRARE